MTLAGLAELSALRQNATQAESLARRALAVQEKTDMKRPTWPSEDVSMQLHMDFRVPNVEELERHRGRAESLGATLLQDRSDDEDEPLYVFADPAGHPFCFLVSAG